MITVVIIILYDNSKTIATMRFSINYNSSSTSRSTNSKGNCSNSSITNILSSKMKE